MYAIRAALEADLPVSVMIETLRVRKITADVVSSHPMYISILADFPEVVINLRESPWMPLSPGQVAYYPDGIVIDNSNVSGCCGCDSVLSTATIQADGNIGACCGLGMRLVPELQIGNINETSVSQAMQVAGRDFLKRWIRADGPERILAWAASHDSTIVWEGLYAHRCQACLRLYQDEKVRTVIRNHHQEKIADVLFSEWLLHRYTGTPHAAETEGA
jgi:hypothetical protein